MAHGTQRARHTARLAVIFAVVLSTLGGAAYAATGIDVSRWQHGTSVNWSKVKADGIDFAFVKATEGSTYTNSYFAADWAATRNVGIYHGAYHFARPSLGSAERQARYFVSKAGTFGGAGDLPPVLDLEATGGLGVSSLRSWTATWLSTVKQLTGRAPLIYCSPSFWETYLGNSTAFHAYPLWIAHYTSAAQPRVPGGWPTWTFWQNTSAGRVAGISGNVDMNRFNGSNAALARLAHAAGTQDPDGPPSGTTVPPAATSTSLTADTGTASGSEPVAFSGQVRAGSPAAPAPGRPVSLYRRAEGAATWQRLATTTSDTSGRFTITSVPTVSADYQARAAGGTTYAASVSPTIRVSIAAAPKPRTATRIDLHSAAPSIRKGRKVRLYGHLLTRAGAPLPGQRVRFYRRPVGATSWTYIRTVTSVAPTGWYQTYVAPRHRRVYKAVVVGNPRYVSSRSNLVRVAVR